jgi:hypothetical protein
VFLLSFKGGIFITEWWLNTTAGTVRIFIAIGVSVRNLASPLLTGV